MDQDRTYIYWHDTIDEARDKVSKQQSYEPRTLGGVNSFEIRDAFYADEMMYGRVDFSDRNWKGPHPVYPAGRIVFKELYGYEEIPMEVDTEGRGVHER